MAKPPESQPLVNIPGIDDASTVELHVKGRGSKLKFKMFVEKAEVLLDPDNEWMPRQWYGVVIRELNRRNWTYSVKSGAEIDTYTWRKP